MSDEYQIVVPPSFIALYLVPGRHKPSAPRDEIAARHEFCEDLASALCEQATTRLWEMGITETDVLQTMQRGLLEPGSVLAPAEARWVMRRLAEMLGCPALPDAEDAAPAG